MITPRIGNTVQFGRKILEVVAIFPSRYLSTGRLGDLVRAETPDGRTVVLSLEPGDYRPIMPNPDGRSSAWVVIEPEAFCLSCGHRNCVCNMDPAGGSGLRSHE